MQLILISVSGCLLNCEHSKNVDPQQQDQGYRSEEANQKKAKKLEDKLDKESGNKIF